MRLEYLPHLNSDAVVFAGAGAGAENRMWKNLSVANCDADAGAGAKKRKWKKPPMMTMEMYLKFIQSNKKMDLVYHHLNQIIGLHGFKKLHKQHKGVLMDAVNSMELMDPARSTVNMDGVSSDALLSVEDVVNDLSDLNWQESCITSMETLNDVVYQHHQQQQPSLQNSPDTGGSCSGSGSASASKDEHPKRKRRLRKLRDIMEDGDDDVVSGDSAACSAPGLVVAEWLRTKERKMRLKRTNFGKIDWGGGGGGRLDDTPLPAWVDVENQLWPSI